MGCKRAEPELQGPLGGSGHSPVGLRVLQLVEVGAGGSLRLLCHLHVLVCSNRGRARVHNCAWRLHVHHPVLAWYSYPQTT